MLQAFNEMKDKVEQLGDVRGQGLVLGLEMVTDKKSKTPEPELARRVVYEAYQRGLTMIAPIGMFGNVIRVAPPLVITREEVEESLDIFEASL